MKRSPRLILSAFALAMLFLVPAAFAQSASGAFHVDTDEGRRQVEFSARVHPNGSTSGDLKFSGPVSVPAEQDVDGDGIGDPGATTVVSLKVDVDCLRVRENRAAMSG